MSPTERCAPPVDGGRSDTVLQVLQVHGHDDGGFHRPEAVGGQVLDQLGERQAQALGPRQDRAAARHGVVVHQVTCPVAREPSR